MMNRVGPSVGQRRDAGNCIRIGGLFALLIAAAMAAGGGVRGSAQQPPEAVPGISKAASDRCAEKVKSMQELAEKPEPRPKLTTRISEEEINSFLALELKAKFHPSLQSLQMTLEENRLKAAAALDFDNLSRNSTKTFARLVAKLFTGTHNLSVTGKLVAAAGKANFVLDEARFDGSSLPNFLVEEIITAVGQKQKPPFDPLQPSRMPYGIDRVEVHQAQIVVFQ